ncbi:GyrI-like domain-containing protein [Sphingomonas sp. R1]|uniref:GyrI-like domain-containing protein n=1 Tax=Sphingomonas sp. R1 TaxID=399176 RepID=UPI002224A2CE|nr:GyrI-like domain-containing protein [Sphingomonas sp. R1]UYY76883.1 GyrI-like domain-containing protein [Sphingomonas sp. R1]
MSKLDLKRERKALFSAPLNSFELMQAPAVRYLMADGHGDPNSVAAYKEAVESLYATAYAIKFMCKQEGQDFVVAPLEGLWSASDPESFTRREKDDWDWTMMIMVPDFVGEDHFTAGKVKSASRLRHLTETLRLETLEEGLCLQALHVGSYDEEGPLLAKLHDHIMRERGYNFNGRHHEVYLGDPRKTSPAKLKTIIRQPVRERP